MMAAEHGPARAASKESAIRQHADSTSTLRRKFWKKLSPNCRPVKDSKQETYFQVWTQVSFNNYSLMTEVLANFVLLHVWQNRAFWWTFTCEDTLWVCIPQSWTYLNKENAFNLTSYTILLKSQALPAFYHFLPHTDTVVTFVFVIFFFCTDAPPFFRAECYVCNNVHVREINIWNVNNACNFVFSNWKSIAKKVMKLFWSTSCAAKIKSCFKSVKWIVIFFLFSFTLSDKNFR